MQTLLFDLDNTLLDFTRSEQYALTQMLLQLGIKPNRTILNRYSELNLKQWELLEKGLITRDEVRVRRYELLFEELKVDHSPQMANEIYDSYLGESFFYVDGAEDLLQTLSSEYPLYMVTNGSSHIQKGRIRNSGIDQYFKDIFVSEAIGHDKPSIEFFKYCFQRIPKIKKDETFIIGDSLTSDILGGTNAGIQTVWYNPTNLSNTTDITPMYEIKKLNELYTIIDK